MVSGAKDSDLENIQTGIETIGGELSINKNFDPKCTHLVMINSNVNAEKFLSAVASGKWILKLSYLEQSVINDSVEKEEDHEWGPELQSSDANLKQDQAVRAPKIWREKISKTGARAFENWKVILYLHPGDKREIPLESLLLCGGATVIYKKPPFSNLEGIKYAFLDSSSNTDEEFKLLYKSGIPCLKPTYLADFLLKFYGEVPPASFAFYLVHPPKKE